MRLIDADEVKRAFIGNRYGTKAIEYVIDNVPTVEIEEEVIKYCYSRNLCLVAKEILENMHRPIVIETMNKDAIPIEQLLSILPKYDDYIHTKTYPYNETMEDIYSKGHEDGWNACLKAIKEELDNWEKENGRSE